MEGVKKRLITYLGLLTGFLFMVIPQKIYGAIKWSDLIDTNSVKEPIEKFSNEFGILVNGFLGFGVSLGVLVFIVNVTKLARYSNNPAMRNIIVHRLLYTLVCVVGLGGTMTIYNVIVAIAVGN